MSAAQQGVTVGQSFGGAEDTNLRSREDSQVRTELALDPGTKGL